MSRERAHHSAVQAAEDHLQELRVDSLKQSRRHSHSPVYPEKHVPKVSSRSTDYVYVNKAFVGTHVVAETRHQRPTPVTSVQREQYWACSKWPMGQRILAIAVGVLVGAVVGLAVTMALKGKNADEVIGSIFPDLTRNNAES